jgi:hypothetical protein
VGIFQLSGEEVSSLAANNFTLERGRKVAFGLKSNIIATTVLPTNQIIPAKVLLLVNLCAACK